MMLDFFADGEMQVAFDTDHGETEDREISLFGVTFKVKQERGSMPISQDSMIVGNTLWNSSIALTRYIESGAEGTSHEFSSQFVKGKRAIELGAGCAGLVGLSMACLGCSEVTYPCCGKMCGVSWKRRRNYQWACYRRTVQQEAGKFMWTNSIGWMKLRFKGTPRIQALTS